MDARQRIAQLVKLAKNTRDVKKANKLYSSEHMAAIHQELDALAAIKSATVSRVLANGVTASASVIKLLKAHTAYVRARSGVYSLFNNSVLVEYSYCDLNVDQVTIYGDVKDVIDVIALMKENSVAG